MKKIESSLWVVGLALAMGAGTAQALPPPPPGDGGGDKPPVAPPPGKIYFEDNVIIVGPGFVKPASDGGTVYVDLTTLIHKTVIPGKTDPGKTVVRVVKEVGQAKSQVEALAGAVPAGVLDPVALLAFFKEDELTAGRGVFDDPAFLHEETGAAEPSALDRTEQARSGGAAVKTAPEAPVPAGRVRGPDRSAIIPSYWQLPLR